MNLVGFGRRGFLFLPHQSFALLPLGLGGKLASACFDDPFETFLVHYPILGGPAFTSTAPRWQTDTSKLLSFSWISPETSSVHPPCYPPRLGSSHGVPDQYHLNDGIPSAWPSVKLTLLRPLWRRCGPPQFGPLEVTQPPQGALLPGSWTIQQPAFSGDCGVTHFLGLVVLTG